MAYLPPPPVEEGRLEGVRTYKQNRQTDHDLSAVSCVVKVLLRISMLYSLKLALDLFCVPIRFTYAHI
jgi:hypothetical protein